MWPAPTGPAMRTGNAPLAGGDSPGHDGFGNSTPLGDSAIKKPVAYIDDVGHGAFDTGGPASAVPG